MGEGDVIQHDCFHLNPQHQGYFNDYIATHGHTFTALFVCISMTHYSILFMPLHLVP